MAPRTPREDGFSLIELLVAITLIGVIMSGLAFGITTALAVTRDSRERTIAANLASQEIDLALSVPATSLEEGVLERVERVGVADFTIRRESQWENATAEAQACTALANSATGRGRRFLQVNVTVTWTGIGARAPVRASTAITPSVSSYRAGFGHVAVTVRDRDGGALAGITVTLAGNGISRTVTSTSIGCAFFTDVPPGTYTVTLNQVGYVDFADATQLATESVVVSDRETTRTAFTYERRAGLTLTLTSPQGGTVPRGVIAVAQGVAPVPPTRFSAAGTDTTGRRSIGVDLGGEGLFPFTGGWTAWAGCEHNRPDLYGGTATALTPGPGATADGTVQAGTLRISASGRDLTRANQTIFALDQAAVASSPCASRIALGTFDAFGTFSGDVVLPFGDWRLYAGLSALPMSRDPRLLQVRPGTPATYTERLSYRDAVTFDAPFLYYRLDESPVFSALDASGGDRTGTYQPGVSPGAAGALSGEANGAATFDGTTTAYVSNPAQFANPNVFTMEAWFATTTTRGGKIFGFGNAVTGTSWQYDRHVYMLDTGQLVFGVYPGAVRTVQSPGRYNDGQWHHVVATLGGGGMALYVDGALVAAHPAVTTAENYTGSVRIGYDNLNGWPGPVTSHAFAGTIDEYAAYGTALPAARVVAHYAARTGPNYRATVLADAPVVYHRLDEFPALDSSGNRRHGTYLGGVTGGWAGALLGDSNTAVTLDGSAGSAIVNPALVTDPDAFSLEAWFATTSNSGGRIVGFGNALTGTSTTADRHLYLQNNGTVSFGVTSPGGNRRIRSPLRYRDGAWHHVVATLGPGGMALYVDGQLVASDPTTGGVSYAGYWRVGADTLAGWPNQPTSSGLQGAVDEVAVYHSVLTPAQVLAHYAASGR